MFCCRGNGLCEYNFHEQHFRLRPDDGTTVETSPTYPRTPYGISKLCAELIHEGWLWAGKDRRLIVCRPGVIYGREYQGNILRMGRKSLVQRGYFFFPGQTTLRKSYGYIEGLIDSFEFAIGRHKWSIALQLRRGGDRKRGAAGSNHPPATGLLRASHLHPFVAVATCGGGRAIGDSREKPHPSDSRPESGYAHPHRSAAS